MKNFKTNEVNVNLNTMQLMFCCCHLFQCLDIGLKIVTMKRLPFLYFFSERKMSRKQRKPNFITPFLAPKNVAISQLSGFKYLECVKYFHLSESVLVHWVHDVGLLDEMLTGY